MGDAGTIVGVDGCRGGWIAAIDRPGAAPRIAVYATFAALIDAVPDDALIAVDMPIGLPERTGPGGSGPEAIIRPLLGQRQSSVFSIPPRAAILHGGDPFRDIETWYRVHREASELARALSEPPRGVSIQAFGIFPRILELDRLLVERPDLRRRVFESHPELAFRALNGDRPMTLPKKIRSRVNPEGMDERRLLLGARGVPATLLAGPPPRGAGDDDLLDACAMLVVAQRRRDGRARPYPDPPAADERGIEIAIWA